MATSKTPTRKIGSGALAGAATTILVWGGETYASMDIPAEVAAAATTIIGFGLAYFVPDKKTSPTVDTEPSVADGELGE